jgi:hypothetical protein
MVAASGAASATGVCQGGADLAEVVIQPAVSPKAEPI